MILFENDNEYRGATFSKCGKHRFVLWRSWGDGKEIMNKIAFIGLNPSTANETKDDPTIRRVMGLAKSWGYNGVYMLNLFSFVSAFPWLIETDPDFHLKNMEYLKQYVGLANKRVVFAWGNFKKATEISPSVITMFPGAYALHINKNGSPKHPLYVKKDVQLIKFNQK